AKESNNELVVELVSEGNNKEGSDKGAPGEEDQMLLSELQEKRRQEGTLRTFRSNYYIEGLLRRSLKLTPSKGS
ncbi:MAG TPA: peptidase S55, partial [Synergistaceae bacterium]|nr:peptidase S55 [Synergistaceae bacterium]